MSTAAADRILDSESTLAALVASPEFLVEITETLAVRLQTACLALPKFRTPDDDEDAFLQEKAYQDALQVQGDRLLPAMKVFARMANDCSPTMGAYLMTRLFAPPGAMTFLNFMIQHTDIKNLRERL